MTLTIDELRESQVFDKHGWGKYGEEAVKLLLAHINELEVRVMTLENRINNTVYIAQSFAQIDGAHHKLWTIDKMLRELLGAEGYKKFVEEYEAPYYDPQTGEEYNPSEWETGIAP